MLAAQEAGCTLSEFLDLDGLEYQAWTQHALTGPSSFRLQLLIAQLIQIVSAFVSKKAVPIDHLLPYYDAMIGNDTPTAQSARERKIRDAHKGLVESLMREEGI